MIDSISIIWLRPRSWSELTEYQLVDDFSHRGYLVPAGFITDGASIPYGMRDTFNPMGKPFPAAILHDHKCKRNDYSRKQADKELYRDLQSCGVNKRRAWLMYAAVRAYAITTGKR